MIGGVTGTGTITDNDPVPSLSINDVSGTTSGGHRHLHRDPVGGFRADRDGRLQHQQRHGDGGSDYTSTSGTLTFAPRHPRRRRSPYRSPTTPCSKQQDLQRGTW